jgi:tetratricopeptide (TPR) repeat protein
MKTLVKHFLMTTILGFALSFPFLTTVKAQSPAAAKMEFDANMLQKAKDAIEKALENPKHSANWRTWYYRGLIYAAIPGHAVYSKIDADPITKALESYKKADELAEKPADKKSVADAKKSMWVPFINFGVEMFNAGELDKAYTSFKMGHELNPEEDTMGLMYAANAAYRLEKFDDFKPLAKEILASTKIKGKLQYYALYAFALTNEGRELQQKDSVGATKVKEEALKIVQEGLKLDKTLDPDAYKNLEAISFGLYVDLNKLDEALSYMKKSIEQDPQNATNYFNMGILYERKGDTENALKSYEESSKIKPSFDAYYNIGAIYYNKGAEINKVAANMDLEEYNKKGKAIEDQAKVEFKKALPHFEKVYDLKLADNVDDKIKLLSPMANLYRILGVKDKEEKFNKELKALTGE